MTATKTAHLPNNFDFIRIVAASMVLLSHHFALTGQAEPSFFGLYSLGGLAVAIFFAISGYLVAISWARDPNLLRFGWRRFLRIWPALTCVVILAAFVLGPLVTTLPTATYLQHGATWNYLRALLMQIHYVLPGVFEHNPYAAAVNGSLWTIPFEVRCYIVLGLAGLVGLLRYRPVFLLCITAYMVWFLTTSNADTTGTMHYGRELSAFFLLGAALAVLEPSWRRHPALWALVLGSLATAFWVSGWRHTAMLIALPFFIINTGTCSTPFVRRAGRFGDPSYGIYLFAFPIQQAVIFYCWPEVGFGGTLALAAGITVLAAYASWHCIEKQALKLKPNSSGKPMLARLAVLTNSSELRTFILLLAFLCIFYLAWLIACWPGMLGQDSLAIILEIETGREFQANKPAFWYLFNLLLYGSTGRVEIPIAVQMAICALISARILTWLLMQQMYKSFFYCLAFICLAPSVVFYIGSMYSDGIYAVALAGMLFEIWICIRRKSIDRKSALILLLSIPFAVFSRPNGIINLLPVVVLAFLLAKDQRKYLAAIALPGLFVGFGSQLAFKYDNPIGSFFPLALYETVGFLEHRPMGLWEFNEPRVTPKTLESLTAGGATLEQISDYYDHYYWDPLIFFPKGPALLSLPKKDKKIIIQEFFKYNLWHNFPAFAASRVNIFFYAAMARASMPGPLGAKFLLPRTKSVSMAESVNLPTDKYLLGWFDFSIKYRAIYWAPWLGLALIAVGARRCMKHRDIAVCTMVGIYALQFIAVFTFSIAGEYRYLLAFFTAPLALLPALYSQPDFGHA